MVTIQASSVANMFNKDGIDYPIGQYTIFYEEINGVLEVGIRDLHTKEVLVHPQPPNQYTNGVDPYGSIVALLADLSPLLGFNLAGATALKTNGFIDYNDTTGSVSITSDTWVDVPNDGAGAFTNKTYKPTLVNELIDVSTGYLDFTDLTLGSQIIVRNDFTITPNTNNSLLEVRYVLGQGAGEYALKFWSERLDSGSGINYQRVISFPIYMGDINTKGGPGKLQVKLSTDGTLVNAGSYINIQLR